MSHPNYFDAMDYPAMIAEYGRPDQFIDRVGRLSPEALREVQNRRFLKVMEFAWKVPFYQRLWGAAGVRPGDISSLDDITRLPTYSKGDLMASVEAHPPLGDFHGLDSYPPESRPPRAPRAARNPCYSARKAARFRTFCWPAFTRCRALAGTTSSTPSMGMGW